MPHTFLQAGDLVDTFHLPMPVAAKRHGMSPHKFRSLYTKRGITKWPYRLLRPPVASRLHFVEDLLTDLVTCLADKDLRAVPTVVRTDLPAEVPTATLTRVKKYRASCSDEERKSVAEGGDPVLPFPIF